MNFVLIRCFDEVSPAVWVPSALHDVVVSISTAISQTEEAKTRSTIRHGAEERTASIEIDKRLFKFNMLLRKLPFLARLVSYRFAARAAEDADLVQNVKAVIASILVAQ